MDQLPNMLALASIPVVVMGVFIWRSHRSGALSNFLDTLAYMFDGRWSHRKQHGPLDPTSDLAPDLFNVDADGRLSPPDRIEIPRKPDAEWPLP